MKSFIISAGTFPYDVMFHFGTAKQMRKEMEKYYGKKEYSSDIDNYFDRKYVATYAMFPDNKSFIHFPNFKKDAQHYGTLVHEIMHAVFAILDRVGVEYFNGGENGKAGSEEVFTYLLQHLTTLALHELEDMEF